MNSGAPEGLAVPASQPTLTKYKYKYIYSTSIKHETPTKQMGVKTNRTSFLCEIRSGHHNTELKTCRHVI